MFAGASISKPLTATLAMQQVERGVFDLDENVNRYLIAWRVPENEFTERSPVTLRHLLSHKAGTTVHGFASIDEIVAKMRAGEMDAFAMSRDGLTSLAAALPGSRVLDGQFFGARTAVRFAAANWASPASSATSAGPAP